MNKERDDELARLRRIHENPETDTRRDFDYKPGSDGCGCRTCEKRRRLGIGGYAQPGIYSKENST